MSSQEMTLDYFYNNDPTSRIQEVYDIDPFDLNSTSEYTTQSQRDRSNATAFRRRQPAEETGQQRGQGYNSFEDEIVRTIQAMSTITRIEPHMTTLVDTNQNPTILLGTN